MLLSAQALLDRDLRPGREEIAAALSGNLCRCTGYDKIIRAVERAAGGRRGRMKIAAVGQRIRREKPGAEALHPECCWAKVTANCNSYQGKIARPTEN